MAKNVTDTCMFCGDTPCSCNAPAKKKAQPKRKPAPKAQPQSQPVQPAQPVQTRQPAQPPMVAQRKALASSKRAIPTGPAKFMPKAKAAAPPRSASDKEQAELELTKALRTLDFFGILSTTDKRRLAPRLRHAVPSADTKAVLDRTPNHKKGGE